MDIVLKLTDGASEIEQAVVQYAIVDQSQADAPSENVAKRRLGPFPVTSLADGDNGKVLRFTLPPMTLPVDRQLAINFRVIGTGRNGKTMQFLNPSEVLLPAGNGQPVSVDLVSF